ncbi:hypothetical protein [Seleniivibrio woodruffii]|uniref:Uncharacterized protein n=1 Tax=Seleniivibrio woodruffii TaxID=1078050 RepID=A0A4R1KC94_9BACT|nr:hypothetical protein [Seleniivibrio woodruffii]TCK61573.1 hypothetical protein C8D98_0074 [Seleniivibrio woodruffii]TVZ35312.1 hypothetical protein OF66_0919 [Seleniivibrio woodruffii]
MLESIALALVKTLATFLFKTYVLMAGNVSIDGAPYWYMKNVSSSVCVYDYKQGGLETVDAVKLSTAGKMKSEIEKILETVIYSEYSNLKDPKEKQFVYMFKNDPEASIFINQNIQFPNLEYSKKYRTAFAQGCIDKEVILEYQTRRIDKIKYELTHKRAGDAFDELDKGDISVQ